MQMVYLLFVTLEKENGMEKNKSAPGKMDKIGEPEKNTEEKPKRKSKKKQDKTTKEVSHRASQTSEPDLKAISASPDQVEIAGDQPGKDSETATQTKASSNPKDPKAKPVQTRASGAKKTQKPKTEPKTELVQTKIDDGKDGDKTPSQQTKADQPVEPNTNGTTTTTTTISSSSSRPHSDHRHIVVDQEKPSTSTGVTGD